MYSAGCNVSYTLPPGALPPSWHLSLYSIILWICEHASLYARVCECECVQMPFQQGAAPLCRWHFYWRNVTTAIFFPYVCVCVCLWVGVCGVWVWECLIRSWQASIDFTGEACYVPNTRISSCLGTMFSSSFIVHLFPNHSNESNESNNRLSANMSVRLLKQGKKWHL